MVRNMSRTNRFLLDCVWTTHSEADAAFVEELASLDRLAAEQAAEEEREIEDYPVACPFCGQTYG